MGIEVGGSNQGQGRTLTLGGAIPTAAPVAPVPAPVAAPLLALSKGDGLVLVKADGAVNQVRFGGGWDPSPMGASWDIDITAIVLDGNNKTRMGKFVCFDARYRTTEDNAIKHNGDNTTGKGDGIDESIDAYLTQLAPTDQKIKLFAHIFDGRTKGQHFGLIANAFIQLEEINTRQQLARYSLTNEYHGFTAVELGELVRVGTAWQFNATGVGLNEECGETLQRYL